MKVAVFGGTGFVGKYILNALKKKQYDIYTLVRLGSESKISHIQNINIVSGNIDSPTSIEQTLMNCSAVIYNIGIIREFKSKGITYKKSHFDYAKLVIDQAKKYNIKHFVLMSANGVKLNGTGYQSTKYLAEEYLKASGLNYTIFRPSLIFGKPNNDQEFCSQLRDTMLKLPIPAPIFFEGIDLFKAGQFSMSPIHVENVADFFSKAVLTKDYYMQTYHLGGTEDFNWKQIIQTISKALRKNKWMMPAPVMPIKILTKLFDRFSFFPITHDQITMLLEGNTCDSKELFDTFEISPILFNHRSLSYLRKK